METKTQLTKSYYEKTKTPFIVFIILNLLSLTVSFYLVSNVLGFPNATWTIALYLSIFITVILFIIFGVSTYLRKRDLFLFLLFGGLTLIIGVVGIIYLMINYYEFDSYIIGLLYLVMIMAVASMISYFIVFIMLVGWFGLMNTERKIAELQGGYRK